MFLQEHYCHGCGVGEFTLPSIGMHREGVNGRRFVEVLLKEHNLPAPLQEH